LAQEIPLTRLEITQLGQSIMSCVSLDAPNTACCEPTP